MKVLLIFLLIASMISCDDQLIKGEKEVQTIETLCPEPNAENQPSEIAFDGISQITNITQTSVTLNWKHIQGLKQYTVISFTTTGRKVIRSVNSPRTSIVIKNLTPDTEYRFLVRAMDNQGFTDSNSNIVVARTSPRPNYSNQKSISFNGNQSINIGASSNFKKKNKFSLSMWIKPDLTNVSSEVRLITFHSGPNAGTAISIGLTKKEIILSYRESSGNLKSFAKEVSLDDNSWHHIALSSNLKFIKVYVDGQSIIFKRARLGDFGSHATHLGAYTGIQKGYVGLMDEVSIFNSLIQDGDIKALSNSKAAHDPRDFIASSKFLSWYRMGDSSSDSSITINDITGANDGSPLNMNNSNFVLLTP